MVYLQSDFMEMELSIIIVNYNTAALLKHCIDSVYASGISHSFEIIVIDNASVDNSCALIKNEFPEVVLIENKENAGFSKANNLGIKSARGKLLLFLNSDTIVLKNTIDSLVEFLNMNPHAGAVGPRLLNHDRSIQRSWFDFPTPLKTFSNLLGISFFILKLKKFKAFTALFSASGKPAFLLDSIEELRTVDYLTLACLMVKTQLMLELGMLDENIFFYHEDCELGFKLKSHNYQTFYLPKASLVHLGGSSSQKRIIASFQQYYMNLKYVYKKYQSPFSSFLMNSLLLLGMLLRACLWPFGLYRKINMFGVYAAHPDKVSSGPKSIDVLRAYLFLIIKILKGV
jgi:GT2 family glycosyltransferase